jgi:amino acid adenylation domain-containing protein
VSAATGTLHGDVEAAARARPDAVALADGTREITFAELIAMADGVAAAVAERSAGEVVGVLLPPGLWTTVAALGALRAGRAYMPLDPGLPRARLEAMTAAVDCDCLLTDSAAGLGDWFDGGLVATDAAALTGRAPRGSAPVGGDDLAYVIFTSGSTGTPNAVGVQHGPASAFVAHTAARLRLSGEDVVLQLHSTSFDSSIEEVWATLAAGARLVAPETSVLEMEAILAQAAERRVTVLHMVTSYWRAFVAELLGGLSAGALERVRHVETGGEAMRREDFEAWQECELSSVPLHNGYGPTEAVVTATGFLIGPGTELPPAATMVPIGRPLPGRLLSVRDDEGEVAAGEVGELFIGGDLLAKGYLNDPALTARRFLPDPARAAGRMYRTGDLVRELPDGALEFLGRADEQVKVRGYRVELGEVAAALRRLDGVGDAAVVLLDERSGRLGAAVVLEQGCVKTGAEMAAELGRSLPAYMVPPVVEPVAAVPVSVTSGKVERQAVRALLAGLGGDGE